MQQRSNSHQFVQVFLIVSLMGIIAWLATWQETPVVQLSEQDHISFDTTPWSEEHLVIPVSTPIQYYPTSELTQAM